jgi:hypothetical protein
MQTRRTKSIQLVRKTIENEQTIPSSPRRPSANCFQRNYLQPLVDFLNGHPTQDPTPANLTLSQSRQRRPSLRLDVPVQTVPMRIHGHNCREIIHLQMPHRFRNAKVQ